MDLTSENSYLFRNDTIVIPKQVLDSVITVNNPDSQKYKQQEFNKEKELIIKNPFIDSIVQTTDLLSVVSKDKSLIANYIDSVRFLSNRDSNCYISKNHTDKFVSNAIYLEKREKTGQIKKEILVSEKQQNSADLMIIPMLFGLFLLAFMVSIYRKYLGRLLKGVFNSLVSNKLFNEKNIHFQRIKLLLDVLFIISFSLFIDQFLGRLDLYSPPNNHKYLIFFAFLSLLVILRFFRWSVFRFLKLLSNQKLFLEELFISSFIYTRGASVFLLPIVFLITYSNDFIAQYLIYFSVFIMISVLIMRTVSMIKVFIVSGFSIFYFILYLCALEIVPLLVIIKEVVSR
jgi:hypothetical protein